MIGDFVEMKSGCAKKLSIGKGCRFDVCAATRIIEYILCLGFN